MRNDGKQLYQSMRMETEYNLKRKNYPHVSSAMMLAIPETKVGMWEDVFGGEKVIIVVYESDCTLWRLLPILRESICSQSSSLRLVDCRHPGTGQYSRKRPPFPLCEDDFKR